MIKKEMLQVVIIDCYSRHLLSLVDLLDKPNTNIINEPVKHGIHKQPVELRAQPMCIDRGSCI